MGDFIFWFLFTSFVIFLFIILPIILLHHFSGPSMDDQLVIILKKKYGEENERWKDSPEWHARWHA